MISHVMILIVDDDRSCRMSLMRLLRGMRYQVVTADSGAEALRVALREKPAVIVMDIHLDDHSGIDVARALKKHPSLAATRFIALSASVMRQDSELEALFHRVLVKPCQADVFREAIDGCVVPTRT